MKNGIINLGFVLILAACAAVAGVDSPNAPTVKRLDGTTISAQEIDATVTRLMRAAKIPGAGIAIFNDGNVV